MLILILLQILNFKTMEERFTLAEIKIAFFESFHEYGELWFDYLGSPQENQDSTEKYWSEFEEKLLG
jgi:hypothetical protein